MPVARATGRSAVPSGGYLELWRPGGQKTSSDVSVMDHKRHRKGLTARGVRPHGCATVEGPAGGQHGSSAESLRVDMNGFDVHGMGVGGGGMRLPPRFFSG